MIIRPANKNDAAEINRLNKKLFHEKNRDILGIIIDKDSRIFVAVQNNNIIGFSGVKCQKWNNTVKVIDIFIHPQFRRQGIGKKLIKRYIAFARKNKARAIIAEAPSKSLALPLYLKCGFRVCGYNDRYYNNSGKEIAIFLSYDLK